MVTVIDTIRSLSDLMETVFGDAPTTKDITEGFERPCTYIQPVDVRTEWTETLRYDTYEIEIYRFSARTDRGWIELLQAQESLENVLSRPIPVNEDFSIYPEDLSFTIQREDMVLISSFTLQNFQVLPEVSDAETMETLNLSRKE